LLVNAFDLRRLFFRMARRAANCGSVMQPGSGLLERESEIAALSRLVDALATSGTGASVLIEGEAGIGKSSLLAAMVAAARERGELRALTARGTELELELAFGGVRQLLRPVVAMPAEEREPLVAGPAALAGAVLGLRDAAASELADPLYGCRGSSRTWRSARRC
jgi:predicted ATPase